MKKFKIFSQNTPPPDEESDKVLRELKEHREKTMEDYNRLLTSLHGIFPEEPNLVHTDHNRIIQELRRLIDDEQKRGDDKNVTLDSLSRELSLQKNINHTLLHYIETSSQAKAQFDDFLRRFHTYLLQFTQYIAPFAHDLHAEVARQLTVFPIERMDLVFTDLIRQMEQMRTDIERLKLSAKDVNKDSGKND